MLSYAKITNINFIHKLFIRYLGLWILHENKTNLCWKEYEAAFKRSLKISRNTLEFSTPFNECKAIYLRENERYKNVDLIIKTDKTSSLEWLFNFIKDIKNLSSLHIKRIKCNITKNSATLFAELWNFFLNHKELEIRSIEPKLRENKLPKLVKEIQKSYLRFPYYRDASDLTTLIYVDKLHTFKVSLDKLCPTSELI